MIRGGMPVGEDGRTHTTFTHNPSSLRLSSIGPNLQNIPRGGKGTDDVARWVKECFVAPAGKTFWARDYSGIEAVLVGYFAHSSRYIRLAKLGVHDFVTAHMVGVSVDLGQDDDSVREILKGVKKEYKAERTVAKRIVHGSNYMMTPAKMYYEYPDEFENIVAAAKLQGLYFELFPEIRTLHRDICQRVDGTKRRRPEEGEVITDPWTLGVCYAKNPFGYVHHFYNVVQWKKVDSRWTWSFGDDAKRLVSFLPQSTAAAILKQSTKKLWNEYPLVGQTMRLLIHDEIFGECDEEDVEECLSVSKHVMELPIPQLPLDPAWNMGEYLTIQTEGKVGNVWGGMNEVR